jgi:hypothetical protein
MELQIASGMRQRTKSGRRLEVAPLSRRAGEGEGGCLFDEISNLVEPSERPGHGWLDQAT